MKVKVVNKSKHDLPNYSTIASAGMDMRANIVAHTDGNNHKRKQLVENIKQMIADEIAVRQTTANFSANHNLRRMILESVSKISEQRTYTYSAPPISIG